MSPGRRRSPSGCDRFRRARERFRQREQEILDDPKADFPPPYASSPNTPTEKLFKRYKPRTLDCAKVGYDKTNEFIRRFVAAGGILKEGSDPPRGMAAC